MFHSENDGRGDQESSSQPPCARGRSQHSLSLANVQRRRRTFARWEKKNVFNKGKILLTSLSFPGWGKRSQRRPLRGLPCGGAEKRKTKGEKLPAQGARGGYHSYGGGRIGAKERGKTHR